MKKHLQKNPSMICGILFSICLCIRFIEYSVIRTDETALGENLIHKTVGIILLFLFLKVSNISWTEIGFDRHGVIKNILTGLFLGTLCFAVSYSVEIILLSVHGSTTNLEMYISVFSLTGKSVKHTEIRYFLLCIAVNIINVWMEEGLFRGFIIKAISNRYSFVKANIIAATLFGIWHFVMPVRSFLDGDLKFIQMIILTAGYIVLSGLMSIKWGLLYKMTGTLWLGAADHFFNNAVASNMLHVVTESETDELQIVRIVLAQIISFIFVAIFYRSDNSRPAQLNN